MYCEGIKVNRIKEIINLEVKNKIALKRIFKS